MYRREHAVSLILSVNSRVANADYTETRFEGIVQQVLRSVAGSDWLKIEAPVAAWTSTRWPARRAHDWCRHASAVRKTVGTVAACSAVSGGGTGTRVVTSATTAVPRQPVAWPNTVSPTLGAQLCVQVGVDVIKLTTSAHMAVAMERMHGPILCHNLAETDQRIIHRRFRGSLRGIS